MLFRSIAPSANVQTMLGSADNAAIRSNIGAGTGNGTVTSIGVTTANGVSGSSSGGATPSLTITLGDITPSSSTVSGLIKANRLNLGWQTIATAGGTTTLTATSPYETEFTGTLAQNCDLPDATTLTVGHRYKISNNSTGLVTIRTNGGATFWILAASTDIDLVCTDIGTAAGTWEKDYRVGNNATGKVATFNSTSTWTGTDGQTYTMPTTSKTIAANDGSNLTISGQAIGDIPVASSTTAYGKLAAVATGSYLRSAGTGTAPVWSTLTLPNAATTGDILTATGTNAIGVVPAVATGSVLLSQGTGTAPVYQNTRENWTTFVVSGSDATTTGQVLVDITGLVSGTLTNSTLYEVQAWLYVGTTAVTTGTQYAIFGGGTGGAAVVSALMTGTTTTNATTSVTLSAPATAAGTFLTTSGTSGMIFIHGFVTTRGTGTATISLQHLKVTSGTSTVKIGSKLQIRQAN